MMELEITPKLALEIWWAYFWRAILFCLLAGGIAGGIVGFIIGVIYSKTPDVAMTYVHAYGKFIGYLVSVPVSAMAFKFVLLKKKFKGFRIALIKSDENIEVK